MIPKQDRQGVRTARDIEQKYDLNKDFSSIEKLASNANRTAQNAMSTANNAATLAEEVNTSLEEFSQSTAEQFETVSGDIGELSESVGIHSENIQNLDERLTDIEESGIGGERGEDGATFTPSVDSAGNLSWTNDKGLVNPAPVNIKGEKGDTGANGVSATHSWSGTTLTVTSASGTSSADLKGEKGDKGDKGDGVSFTTDASLTLANGVLKVNTANAVEANNTLPVTSAAVHAIVGDIEALLATI